MHERLHKDYLPALQTLVTKYRNVNGFSYSVRPKITQGVQTDIECIRVFVERKLSPLAAAIQQCTIPDQIGDYPTDIIEIGKMEVQQEPYNPDRGTDTKRYDSLQGGMSFCHYKATAATLGIVLRDKVTKKPMAVSNMHVIFNLDIPGLCGQVGDHILQPGRYDGGKDPQDWVASATRAGPVDPEPSQGSPGDMACAEINLALRSAQYDSILSPGLMKGARRANIGETIYGCSRNGDFKSIVMENDGGVIITGYGCVPGAAPKQYWYSEQTFYTPGWGPGSSGTIGYTKDRYAVCLNTGGSGPKGGVSGTIGVGADFINVMQILNLESGTGFPIIPWVPPNPTGPPTVNPIYLKNRERHEGKRGP